MLTIRQHLEAIRFDLVDPSIAEQHLRLRVMHDVEAALTTLDASSTMDGALQTDVYRVIADDPHRTPERIAR